MAEPIETASRDSSPPSSPASMGSTVILDLPSDPPLSPLAVPSDAQPQDHAASSQPRKPWIKVVEETRLHSGTLVNTRIVETDSTPPVGDRHDPVMEHVKALFVSSGYPRHPGPPPPPPGHKPGGAPSAIIPPPAEPVQHLVIRSPALIAAVKQVVQYHPRQNLNGTPLTVRWPYHALVHHYSEFKAMRNSHTTGEPENRCTKLSNVAEHLELLLDFLDREIMPDIRKEEARIKRGYHGREHSWLAFKPGTVLLETSRDNTDDIEDQQLRAFVVHHVMYSPYNPGHPDFPQTLNLGLWSLEYQKGNLTRQLITRLIPLDDGRDEYKLDERFSFQIVDDKLIDKDGNIDLEKAHPLVVEKVRRGKIYQKLRPLGCHSYMGKTVDCGQVDGLVMTDPELAREPNPFRPRFDDDEWRPPAPPDPRSVALQDKPSQIRFDDLNVRLDKCDCLVCQSLNDERVAMHSPKVALFKTLTGPTSQASDLQHLLLPTQINAFVFKTKKWEKLHVTGFGEATFDETMITDSLVMAEDRKATLQALTRSFCRRNSRDEDLPGQSWSADFLPGKGSGMIFLLHGQPGVGKTCTAECVAAYVRRPLMVLSMSDIGKTALEVERKLDVHFTKAQKWGAVLLIDEADVFMQRRTTTDLGRNTLVAAFLRALDNYKGMLFLTTNRVDSFDDAFMSRIHVQLYYPDFTAAERQQVWKTFMDKLLRERGDAMRLSFEAKEYIFGPQVTSMEWNGREIRNAIQSAVQLAEYDGDKDVHGKIVVTDAHFRSVVELSQEFKGQLRDQRRGWRRFDRRDDYDSDSSSGSSIVD